MDGCAWEQVMRRGAGDAQGFQAKIVQPFSSQQITEEKG